MPVNEERARLASVGGLRGGRDPWEALQARYMSRALACQELASAGRGTVGVVGHAVPPEVILAAGLVPIQLAAQLGAPTEKGDRYMEEDWGPEMRSIFDQALRGVYSQAEAIVVDRAHHQLYYYLKEAVRQGNAPTVPPLLMYDFIPTRSASYRNYNRRSFQGLVEQIERVAGVRLTSDRWERAIEVMNARRLAVREIARQRRSGRLSGSASFTAIGANSFMEPEPYARTVEELLQGPLPNEVTAGGSPRVFVIPSDPLAHCRLHEVIEESAAVVVGEEDTGGSRACEPDIRATRRPLGAVLSHYQVAVWSPDLFPRAVRERALRADLAAGIADAVVFYIPPGDRQFGWSYPALKTWLDRRRIPSLLVRDDVLTQPGEAAIRQQLAAFVAGLAA